MEITLSGSQVVRQVAVEDDISSVLVQIKIFKNNHPIVGSIPTWTASSICNSVESE